jgi:dipeptidyl aminopeptidase/acylaminoacyl peptidase
MDCKRRMKMLCAIAACVVSCAVVGRCGDRVPSHSILKGNRTVGVEDSIGMSIVENPNYALGTWGRDDVASFSPSGKRFALIVSRGNLHRNTVDYKLLLYHSNTALSSSVPEKLLSMSSSSTRPAIASLAWLDDHTVAFLGENPGEHHQLYTVNCESKRKRQLTNQPTDIVNYAFASDGKTFFFTADKPVKSIWSTTNRLIVAQESLVELVSGVREGIGEGQDLFVVKKNAAKPVRLELTGMITGLSALWPSPDGRFLALRTIVRRESISSLWYDYQTMSEATLLSRSASSVVEEYTLLDLQTGRTRPLVDAPVGAWYSNVGWSSDSRSLIVSGQNLPVNATDRNEIELRLANLFVAEVEIPSCVIVPITHDDAIIRRWNSQTNELVLQLTNRRSFSSFEEGRLVRFRKSSGVWVGKDVPAPERKGTAELAITVDEDPNTPPRLFAKDLKTGKTAMLLDPNPQFKDLQFGHVEELRFEATGGAEIRAGLYYPPHYIRGSRYPLVIQTHGWNSNQFWIDGPYTTAFAAQSLAARGFVVVQVGDATDISTPSEAKSTMNQLEEIISHLDTIGLINVDRIGIIAFSATGPGVAYAITHSNYHFGAAVLADTDDAGYFTYLSMFDHDSTRFEAINGGAPFGQTLGSWLREAPEFSLDKVTTALRLEPNGAWDVLDLWEWFVGLRRLHKPVEMVVMPDAGHVVTRPQDRMISQGGTVDWLDYWLNGNEDPDPAKKDQYERWHKLRD